MHDTLQNDISILVANDDLTDLSNEVRVLVRDLMTQVAKHGYDSLNDLGGLPRRERDEDGSRNRPSTQPSTQPSGNGGRSSSGPAPWINIIPAHPDQEALCAKLVLAIAHRSAKGRRGRSHMGRPRVGLDMALRLLRENLVVCGSGPHGLYGRTAIVLSDYWDPRRAYESRLDVNGHAAVGHLQSVFLYWDGFRWHRQYP